MTCWSFTTEHTSLVLVCMCVSICMTRTHKTRAHPKSHTDRSHIARRRNLYSYKQLNLVNNFIPNYTSAFRAYCHGCIPVKNTNSNSAILFKHSLSYKVINLNASRVLMIGFNCISIQTSSYRSICRPNRPRKMLLHLKASNIGI
jgi:hypothetical protein